MRASLGLGLIRNGHADGEASDARLAEWTESYDGPNPMIGLEEAVVVPMFDRLAAPSARPPFDDDVFDLAVISLGAAQVAPTVSTAGSGAPTLCRWVNLPG